MSEFGQRCIQPIIGEDIDLYADGTQLEELMKNSKKESDIEIAHPPCHHPFAKAFNSFFVSA